MTHHPSDEDLFAAALIMPDAERAHFLARACADEPARQRLTALLAAFDDAADFVGAYAGAAEHAIESIPSYRLLHELGEGGCGIAYLAEQLDPVRRHVAVKVIKPGMDTKAVVARFAAERQLLALMDHPNVAKVFDAGATAAGRPYFVMELVRGIKITDYCDLMRLSIAERLPLFIQVCHAIQHAHQKSVLHRDIKPSNVLVTMHDGLPMVKVIDFGIAKATQGPLSGQTQHTASEQFIGTPAYVSPEQTDLTQRNVDTRSDIYSLGVLLYELLTGSTPLDGDELQSLSADEMRRRVREEEPVVPSARLKLQQRSSHEIQRDLDWIAMRCLEKDTGRRYQTVNELLLDVQRHLRHEPIVARPPSARYIVAKFARRNRAMVAALLAAAFIVVAFVVNMSIQTQRIAAARDRAEQETQRAQKAAEFMLDTVARAEPFGYAETGQPETAKELLDRAGRWLHENRNQDPEVRARLLEAIGRAYRRRVEVDSGIEFLREALSLRRKLTGGLGDAATVSVMNELATCLRVTSDLPGAERLLQEGDAILQRLGQEHSMLHVRLLLNRGRLALMRGATEAARQHSDEAVALARDLRGPRSPEFADALVERVFMLSWLDDLSGAERLAREALSIYSSTVPQQHPDRVFAQSLLGETLRVRGKLEEAFALLSFSLNATRRMYGDSSRQGADILDSLARLESSRGRLAEAEELSRQSVQMLLQIAGTDNSKTAYYRTSLAMIQSARGEYAEAEAQLRAALATFAKTLQPDHPYAASTEYRLGEALLGLRRPKDAEAAFRASMQRLQRTTQPAWWAARSASGLGEALYRQGRTREAEPYLVQSDRIVAADPNADEESRVAVRERVARFYAERERNRDEMQLASGGSR
ncbi:MAG TPA: tetratricopeptide repeat protein [Steroidobacteraceae bacterium]|nr:tetratricopeptide repeat protein [Steroidobacteraceae bacterium]